MKEDLVLNYFIGFCVIVLFGLFVFNILELFETNDASATVEPVPLLTDFDKNFAVKLANANVGQLGSQHIHTDFKIFLRGKELNFEDNKYYDKSSYLHLDDDSDKIKAASVLHMHAVNVPLWVFFESANLTLPKMRAFVNNKEIQDYKNYVFKDMDRILLTDNTGNLQKQLSSVTNFSSAE